MRGRNETFFSNSEEKILFLIASQQVYEGKMEFTKELALKTYNDRFEILDSPMDKLLESLVKKSLLSNLGEKFSLTDQGRVESKKIFLKYLDFFYSKVMIEEDNSQTFRKIAMELHGQYLGQLNMTDQEQLDKLLSLLNVTENNKILDLGCGLGYITSYIQKHTGATVLGLDNASGALELATQRNEGNRKLQYIHGDINEPDFQQSSLDVIISIDTIYFVSDMFKTLENMKRLLKPTGKMLIFYSQYGFKEEPESLFTPDGTKLAQNLQKLNLKYNYYDFTENEGRHWILKEKLFKENKDGFIKDLSEHLYDSLYEEATGTLENFKTHSFKRYLYEISN